MSNAEDYIPEDEDTVSSSDELLDLSTGDQDQGIDLDELYRLVGESSVSDDSEPEAIIPAEGENQSDEAVHEVSALDELEALYGSSDESKVDETETSSENDESVTESVSDGVSVLEELEALLGSSVESVTDEVEIPSEASGHSSYEEDAGGISALDELKAFLGEVVLSEADEPGDSYATSKQEHSLISRRSVLGELQHLLQSSIDELKATADGDTGKSPDSAEVEYPTRDELKDLLETTLSQLMMISDGSGTSDYMSDGSSVLEELSAILGETTGGADNSDTYIPSDEADSPFDSEEASVMEQIETDKYVSSAEAGYENSSSNKVVGADSVLDELKLLLGETDNIDIETSVISSESGYSTTDVSDESSVLDEFEDLLSGSTETTKPEVIQDYSTTSVLDTGTDGSSVLDEFEGLLSGSTETTESEVVQDYPATSAADAGTDEKSALEELEAYFANSSESEDIGTETPAEQTEAGSDPIQLTSTSDTLEQLEAMLDETNNNINVIEDDPLIQHEASQLSGENKEEKDEDTRDLYHRIEPVEAESNSQIQNSSVENVHSQHQMEGNKRISMARMLLVATVAAVAVIFWNLFDTGDGPDDRLITAQTRPVDKSATVTTELESPVWADAEPEPAIPDSPAPVPAYTYTYTDSDEVLSEDVIEEASTSDRLAEVEDIDSSLAYVETSSYVPEQSYEDEPVQLYEDELANNEGIDSSIETGISQLDNPEVTNEIPNIRSIESINQQIKSLQDENRNSIGLLNERIVEAESLILSLQATLNNPDNEKNISLLNERMIEAESSISSLQASLNNPDSDKSVSLLKERMIEAESSISSLQDSLNNTDQVMQPVQSESSGLSVQQTKSLQDENKENFSALNERISEVESLISSLQLALNELGQQVAANKSGQVVQPVSSVSADLSSQQIKSLQDSIENNFSILNERMVEAELLISRLQADLNKPDQVDRTAVSVSPDTSNQQIKLLQDKNEKSFSLLNDRMSEAESLILGLQASLNNIDQKIALNKPDQVVQLVNSASPDSSNLQIDSFQDENKKSFSSLNERMVEAESSISSLQVAVNKPDQLVQPVHSITPDSPITNDQSMQKESVAGSNSTTSHAWSVHLYAYYGEPPPANEIEYLKTASIPFEIRRVVLKGKVWYRVLVNEFSEYRKAKEYAAMMKNRFGIKKIWISKS